MKIERKLQVTSHKKQEKKIKAFGDKRIKTIDNYDISDETHTIVTIHGKLLDENYTNLLNDNPDLPLEDVIALDKVQKKQEINENELNRLRALKLVKGRATLLQIVGDKKHTRLSNSDLKEKILDLLKEKNSASREDIENLIMPLLPLDLPFEKRQKKISNVLVELSSKDKKIKNVSPSIKYSVWELNRV